MIAAIREESRKAGRPIPADHFGASFAFRFGSRDDPLVERFAMQRNAEKGYAVTGDAGAILRRIEEYRAAGVSKFVLIPVAQGDDDLMEQTRRLLDEVAPTAHHDPAI